MLGFVPQPNQAISSFPQKQVVNFRLSFAFPELSNKYHICIIIDLFL
jgi:hypothetical protein